ncbi:MtrAB system histidine kinase MtrB [Allonocardiopsis opalescens]|uniref:Sensor histidine kinase MtrB n=1 Tax=Allonocardiopsis opalescens TaxID=1144618 RepID=A0A2T0QC71_9ACTN|nr:MtrAB system histidine kinase MtrB [Allonocardiopsis opalescens]PRY01517.1 two-component system sensor histidine kinase MtrB [Allonocardiopsis opalescens]
MVKTARDRAATAAPAERRRRVRSGLRRGYVVVRKGARDLVHRAHTTWRRSLQLRIVTSTLAVSALLTGLLGFFLLQQITAGVLRAKETTALSEHYAGLSYAQNELAATDQTEYDARLDEISASLTERSGSTRLYDVVILPSQPGGTGRFSRDINADSVPQRLRDDLHERGSFDEQYFTYTCVHRDGADRDRCEPGLVVGARLTALLDLYYVFPLTHEADMLELVRSTLIAVGTAMVILLVLVASLVTRQVVLPVRQAAMSAERLAKGELSERMHVRGEDDLARLAMSFNDMAGNLQEKIRELEELSKVQRQFVSDVSHELRTPLTTVRMAADMLHEQREEFDATQGRSIELLHGQVERFEEMLADLLEISRHDAGAATLAPESVDIRDVVIKVVADSEQLAQRKGIKVVLRLPVEACAAELDSRRVERILRNLVVNAIEHSEGKDVTVTAGVDRDAVAVVVRDYGVGLREGEEYLVFDRFWRADPSRVRTTGGTGLGLSIAREDALLHGGWLQAWGQLGRGSQFRLTLPREAGAELRGSPLPLVPAEVEINRSRPVPSEPDPSWAGGAWTDE